MSDTNFNDAVINMVNELDWERLEMFFWYFIDEGIFLKKFGN